MEIIQYSNGLEGAKNPPKQNKTVIHAPDNGFYQQSLYVAAIAQYLGCEGLASPATDIHSGVKYTFDFYHRECGKVFKVLKSDDLSEYEKYVQYSDDGFVIVNADGHPGCQLFGCENCSGVCIVLPDELGEKLHDTDATYIYFRGRFYTCHRNGEDGLPLWELLLPRMLQKFEDEESGDEWEDED